ncbi:MAG: fibronectin type III domain-containing protein, partial [Actinobacteria bacterium]|nr:fibronectin type III domain-containing protein [Actinomycetota bacterium]
MYSFTTKFEQAFKRFKLFPHGYATLIRILTNDDNLMGPYSTDVILPRMYVSAVNFDPNLFSTYGTSIQYNGGTFTWSYSGGSIVADDVYSQEFFVYPYNNTSGSPLYSTTINPGSGSGAPNSTITFTSANLSENTQYTIVIKATMNDGWRTNSTVALRTIVSDQESFTTAAQAPAQPTITSSTDVGTNRPYNNGAVDLVWSQPSGGAAVTGYKIEYSEGPNYLFIVNWVSDTGNSNTSGTFTGLKSDTDYKFYVTALGANGNSPISSASSITRITTVPTAPTGVFAVAGNGGADVSFTATPSGSNGGKSIQYYRATSSPGGITATEVVSPILVEGLTNYTSYTFTVAAYNANGFSAESTASSAVTPQFPLPINNLPPTIASDSASNYIYKVTFLGSWFFSPTSYDYQWQTSSDGGTTWTTRASGTNVTTVPDYNASSYKAQNIRIRIWGRNQTGPSISPANSNTLFVFYTTPVINSFSVTGSELEASYSFSYSTDDPSAFVDLEYKLSSASTWTAIAFPTSSGSIYLKAGTYNFRLTVYNGVDGAYRLVDSTTSATVLKFYTFSFGNTLYPSNNGFIGISGGYGSAGTPPSGRHIGIFPRDLI